MQILIIAEHDNQTLKRATYHAVSAAQQLSKQITVLIIGYQCQSVVEAARRLPVQQILVADDAVYEYQLAENSAALIVEQAKSYAYVITAATTFGKNILPRVAALLNVDMLSDVMQVIAPNQFVRPMYAGNVLATVQLDESIKLLTIRTTAFAAMQAGDQADVPIEKITTVIANEVSRFENQTVTQSKRPELTAARVVISGGRGLKNGENFKLLEDLADCLGAAIGASRAAVDAGFVSNDYQVGQTGKVVAPDLYIAIGISGAIQHLAGMKDSKVVVAINNDPEAPIFQAADYGLVGDLFSVLPALREELEKRR